MATRTGASMNWGGLDRAMERAAKKLSNRTALLSAIGEAMISGVQQRFTDQVDPQGNAWKPTRRGGHILSDTARLRNSIDKAVTNDGVMVGSNLPYALIHQMGGTIKPKNGDYLRFRTAIGFVSVKQVVIDARPYLGLSQDDIEEIRETIADFLGEAFRG